VKLQRWSRPPWIAVIRWRLLLSLLMAEREIASATERASEREKSNKHRTSVEDEEQVRKNERKKGETWERDAQLGLFRSVVASMLSKTCCV
jgi:hypothetical protein